MKRHTWLKYGRTGEMVVITVKDSMDGKLATFKCDNNKNYFKALKMIKAKYGFDYKPEIEKNELVKEKIDWLGS